MSDYEHNIPAYQGTLAAFNKMLDQLDEWWAHEQQQGPVSLRRRIAVRGVRGDLVSNIDGIEKLIKTAQLIDGAAPANKTAPLGRSLAGTASSMTPARRRLCS
ncbi:hypothetical protein [Xanthomonas vasicola]|uniref:hypothetical protein n=1 Tax=Xanthomonas vasicola TaxID=56459 RepID=UPI000A43AF67|nr:hypothetical protein [Xanthomonas vasicola]MDO6983722.1 hypothetical protein [Xanthomonas vasicola]